MFFFGGGWGEWGCRKREIEFDWGMRAMTSCYAAKEWLPLTAPLPKLETRMVHHGTPWYTSKFSCLHKFWKLQINAAKLLSSLSTFLKCRDGATYSFFCHWDPSKYFFFYSLSRCSTLCVQHLYMFFFFNYNKFLFAPSVIQSYLQKCKVHGSVHHKYIPIYIYIYIYIYPTRCNFTPFIYIWKLLYMFRVVPPSIIRSAYNCAYSIWYLSHRYCYLSL
jgi:hypothetical protein